MNSRDVGGVAEMDGDVVPERKERVPRVLFVLNHAGAGGTERYLETLVSHLVPSRMEAMLVYNEEGPLLDRLRALGIRCEKFPMRSRFDVRAAFRLLRIARRFDADVIHSMFLREHYLAAMAHLLGCRSRRMCTVHLMLEQVSNPPVYWLDRFVYRGMDAIITVCRKLGEQMQSAYGIPADRIHPILNGVVPSEASAQEIAADRERIRQELGISNESTLYLTAGRFSEEKGYDFLLEAIRRFCVQKVQSSGTAQKERFLFAGDGPLLPVIREQLDKQDLADGVILAGYRRDLPALLHAADVYVSPSRTEALSLSILEAMDAGLPVIATAVGGTPELIHAEWGNGRLVPYGDADALGEVIASLASDADVRRVMGNSGKVLLREKFALDAMLRQTAALYDAMYPGMAPGQTAHP